MFSVLQPHQSGSSSCIQFYRVTFMILLETNITMSQYASLPDIQSVVRFFGTVSYKLLYLGVGSLLANLL